MKRAVLIFLLLTYTLATLGIGVNAFYCCGKLASIHLSLANGTNDSKAYKAGKDCCKTTHQFIKVRENHVPGHCVTTALPLIASALPVYPFQSSPAIDLPVLSANRSHSPPLRSQPLLYLRNRNFRI